MIAPRGGRCVLRTLLVVTACLLSGASLAEEWTVQTVAVRDLRQAHLAASELTDLGYDAYTEFTMGHDGLQYVRVRVGCFHGHSGAEAIAALLRSVTREAVVVRRSQAAPARGCLRRLVGFVAPADLQQPEPGVATFIVEVAGVRGVVRFMEGRWRVLQEPAADALQPPNRQANVRFRQASRAGRPYVRLRHEDGEFYLCPGRILAETADAVVVEDEGVVVACVWREPLPHGGAP